MPSKKPAKKILKKTETKPREIKEPAIKENFMNQDALADNQRAIKAVDTFLAYAIYENASDIHIEPEEKNVLVRYRLDGVLKTVITLPKNIQPGIIARIKILAGLKIDESDRPQDGHFKINGQDYKASFRVSIIPAKSGEKIILRLEKKRARILSLGRLGLQPGALAIVKKNLAKPSGLILTAGPDGSGKTTTLYTLMDILNRPAVNIMTIEDPIEHRLPRISQSQVNSKIGYTFSAGLRAFLRQDPNIIMVGEIPDQSTAEMTVQAALTGRLVLSSLIAKDAVAALTKLAELGVPEFLTGSAVKLIIAQRLVKRICPGCVQSYKLDKQTVKELKKHFDLENISRVLAQRKIITGPGRGFENLSFYRGRGCELCSGSGYQGEIGLYETLEITPQMSRLISAKAAPVELKKQAAKQELLTLIEDGFIKAKNGITTVEEIMRITIE